MNDAGIYKIINLVNRKIYIGLAVDLCKRWKKHKLALNNNSHENIHLQRAWDKYGEDSFVFEVIERTLDIFELEKLEEKWITEIRSYDDSIGYNICRYGTLQLGLKRSDASKKK